MMFFCEVNIYQVIWNFVLAHLILSTVFMKEMILLSCYLCLVPRPQLPFSKCPRKAVRFVLQPALDNGWWLPGPQLEKDLEGSFRKDVPLSFLIRHGCMGNKKRCTLLHRNVCGKYISLFSCNKKALISAEWCCYLILRLPLLIFKLSRIKTSIPSQHQHLQTAWFWVSY